ncbi:uncharacterized protein LOC129003527 [Macrosteles quadrilineatus]|uniref:uncharacterized protein LOC129003527 n=1 Tax=Macrosteles quadrilineatus TaxID=74068 RepID=UPI0023E11498|nr:uncharacterized protein LOC129003527 [Macrosteles quadrilineatus]
MNQNDTELTPNEVSSRLSLLSEKLEFVSTRVEEMKATQDYFMFPRQHKSYLEEIRNISLPSVRNAFFERIPKLNIMASLLIHLVALLISILFIHDAYDEWRNTLTALSNSYTRAQDMPFPAVTVCENLELKDDYNRFEILQRCLSNRNGVSWLCNEDELNMLRISTDITPFEYDLLAMNKSDRIVFEKLYLPIFDHSVKSFPVNVNQTFSANLYLKYIEKLGKQRLTELKMYNADFENSSNGTVILSSLSSQKILMTPRAHLRDRIKICQTFNAVSHGPQVVKTKVRNDLKNAHGKNTQCSPENMLENGCKQNLLYTDKSLEIEFDDAGFSQLTSDSPEDDENENITHISESKRVSEKYTVFVHNSFTYPSITTMPHIFFAKGSTSSTTLTPSITTIKKGLFEVDVLKRFCIFSHEKTLSLFTFYTYQNCLFECQINCSIAECGCVPYHLAIFNGSFDICSNKVSDYCIERNMFLSWHAFKHKRCKCDCPTECVTIDYTTDPLIGDDYDDQRATKYQVSYDKNDIPTTVRYSVSSTAEFVAYSLGILGVFNGFSMELVWQIAYWFTLGLWSTVRNVLHDNL